MTKVGLRNAWFQVHKWIGLILAAVIIPISLTGSALVWHDPLEKALNPERYALSGTSVLPVARYAQAAQARLGPGERLQRIELPAEAGEPVTVRASKPGKGRPQRLTLFLDPATGKVLDTARSGEGVFQVMHVLHGSLMVPGVGRQIVGWIGVAMLVSSISGLWLWWPLVGSVRRGLRWKRHRNLDANLHHQFGFWISLPLFILSLTGVWISFPQWFAGFEATQAERAPGGPGRFAAPLQLPLSAVAGAVDAAEKAAGGQAVSVAWPTEKASEWTIAVQPAAGDTVGEDSTDVKVAAADNSATVERGAGEQPKTLARLMRRIHDGNEMPLAWQIIVFLGGILPAALAVTGIIMWWRARSWRAQLAQRRSAVAA
ncbi:PepSY-associated TM helix domain-containing protein [Altererythrobacter sp. TH136]|uniref:PepSY-associated TM helix domain-containing protein n=1 Tax=Altererythrobacter sp. TH136 TaxID=2067415 RepID=UPI001161DE6E|nr:PepSY-associated TM helix domain-containing protein [Altererythrobacter sp. TH136]QDM41362.1 PepSY domain-containing protein [Altererythrobacter sp. TH136]